MNSSLRCTFLVAIAITFLPTAVLSFCVSSLSSNHRRKLLFGILSLQEHALQNGHENDDVASASYGLYVHIPYCRRRCNYCDFAIVPIGGGSASVDRRNAGFQKMDDKYKTAVLNEINVIRKTSNNKKKIHLQSIYFGGGTPSLAPLETLQDIMHSIYKSNNSPFYINNNNISDNDTEITIEMDPGTFDVSYLQSIKQIGFNRISLGVQSFDNTILENLGRVHRAHDVYASIEMIHQVFGPTANYSIDLISGVPGLTLAKWCETLYEAAVKLYPRPNHISCYDLQVEEGTMFGSWYRDERREDAEEDGGVQQVQLALQGRKNTTSSRPPLPSAEDCAFMYSYASGYLRSVGYEHYEISSYAYKRSDGSQQHQRSKHNQIYWAYNGQWYAVGLGGTSNVNGVRYARPRALSDYIKWTESLIDNNSSPPPWLYKASTDDNVDDDDSEDDIDNLLDIVMTRLRTSQGLDLDWIVKHEKYDISHVEAILRGFDLAIELGLGVKDDVSITSMGTDTDDGKQQRYGSIRLTDSKGFLFSNNIISNIFLELSELDRSMKDEKLTREE